MTIYEYLSIYLVVQCLFTTISLQIVFKLFPSLRVVWKSGFGIFLLPIFTYIGFGKEISILEAEKKDSGDLKVNLILFVLNPFYLLFGKIRIDFLRVSGANFFLLNNIPSKDKLHLYPPIEKVKVRNIFLKNVNLRIEDKSVFPTFKIYVEDIRLSFGRFDLARSIEVLFFSKRGECKIGNGEISTIKKGNSGVLKMKGLTLGEIISLDFVPMMPFNEKLYLIAEYKHTKTGTAITGNLGRPVNKKDATKDLDHNELKQKLRFDFSIQWNDYVLPFDLALKKIVMKLISGTLLGGVVDTTVATVGLLAKLFSSSPKTIKEKDLPVEKEGDQLLE